MTEQGTDRHGVEYKRTNNDFHVRYLEQDNGLCSVCHGTGAKIEIRYIVRNYESARVKKKICKTLQAHERSLWICPKCIDNFKQKLSVINERNLAQPTVEQPERKTGRWIPHEDEDGEHYGDKCSECGEWYVMPYGKAKYCPNCGADMREADDE